MAQGFITTLGEALARGDLDSVELLYLDEIEKGAAAFETLLQAGRAVARAGENEKAAELLAMLCGTAEAMGPETHLALLAQICLCVPHRQKWRREFTAAFAKHHAGDPVALAYLKAADIHGARKVDEAFACLDTLCKMRENAYVEHPGGWGVGKVREVSPLTGQMIVDLQEKRGHRVDLAAAASIFKPLPDEHFQALLFDRVEQLRAMAEDAPEQVVRCLVASFGSPLAVTAMRDRMVPGVIAREKWSGWWNRARNALKKDPLVRITAGARAQVEFMAAAVSEAGDLLRKFRDGTARDRVSVVRRFRAFRDEEERARLLEGIAALEDTDLGKLEALLLRRELGVEDGKAVCAFLRERGDGPHLVTRLAVSDLARAAVRAVGEEDGFDACVPYFLEGALSTIGEAARLLASLDPGRFVEVLREVHAQPRHHVRPFFWLYSVRMEPQWQELLAEFPPHDVLLSLLALYDFVARAEHREQYGDVVVYGRLLFNKGRFDQFRAMVREAPRETLEEVYAMVQTNRAIKESVRGVMADQIAVICPEVVKHARGGGERTGAAEIDESVIYTTTQGLRRRQEEFQHLVQVEIPRTIEEIGRAQAFGDLSENAEWTAALEKRDRQATRAGEIEAELKKAWVISGTMFHEGRVSIGSEVEVQDTASGERQRWKIFGPWDGDLDDGVLNYLSPVGRFLLGRNVGDVVKVPLPGGEVSYQVLSVEQVQSS